MIGLDKPGNEQECFIFALIEALASHIVPWKKNIQREAGFAGIILHRWLQAAVTAITASGSCKASIEQG